MKANISYEGEQLGQMDVDLTSGNISSVSAIEFPAGGAMYTEYLPIRMEDPLSEKSRAALKASIGKDLKVDVVGEIQAKLGNYSTVISYIQKNLTAVILPF